jgi:hypothetical protein
MEQHPKKGRRRLVFLVLLLGLMLFCFCSGIGAVLGWQHYANTIIVTPTSTEFPKILACLYDSDCRSQGDGLVCVLGKCLPIEAGTETPTPTVTGSTSPTNTPKPPDSACKGTGSVNASSSNNATTVNLNCGQKLNVSVTYCNTCGYTVDTPLTFDPAILRLDGTAVPSTPTGTPMVGGSTIVVYSFSTLKAGNSHLKITSSQSWNPSSRVTNVDFTVKVN